MLGKNWELVPSEMEEHAGRRHQGPEAGAQTGRGESKGKAFSLLSCRVSKVKWKLRGRMKASPLR